MVNYSLPCIVVKYSRTSSTYRASHKRDSNTTLRKSTAGNSDLTDFENAKQAALTLTKVWNFGSQEWAISSAGHDSDSWFFTAQCV